MDGITFSSAATIAVAALATGGVIVRPWGLPEALWATLGALFLVVFALLPANAALIAVGKGLDVYLFLGGMMVLAEVARREGLFDYLAAHAAQAARGSAARLFGLVYLVGIFVTAFLSNDATAVVLTPAVYATAKAAGARPLPYLVACAMIANAASFVLPISNPANLVLYHNRMPPLGAWLGTFALPSVLAIAATYTALRLYYRRELRGAIKPEVAATALSAGGRYAAYGIAVTATLLLAASALGIELGAPTFLAGVATLVFVQIEKREAPWPVLRHVSWGVLPLVAGLFILVAGLEETGLITKLASLLEGYAAAAPRATAFSAGGLLAVATNLMNNLPTGLIAATALSHAAMPEPVPAALLIGVDLGPNLSVTGSLATILWLAALKREGEHCSAGEFLAIGAAVMPPALIAALLGLLVAS